MERLLPCCNRCSIADGARQFGVGQGLRASSAVAMGFTGFARGRICGLQRYHAISAGSGTQVLPACAPFSRWPS